MSEVHVMADERSTWRISATGEAHRRVVQCWPAQAAAPSRRGSLASASASANPRTMRACCATTRAVERVRVHVIVARIGHANIQTIRRYLPRTASTENGTSVAIKSPAIVTAMLRRARASTAWAYACATTPRRMSGSPAAWARLILIEGWRRRPPWRAELCGLIGQSDGRARRGSTARVQLVDERLYAPDQLSISDHRGNDTSRRGRCRARVTHQVIDGRRRFSRGRWRVRARARAARARSRW